MAKEEVRELFQRVMRRLDRLILGKNESLDRIEYDMDPAQVPGEPVGVDWESGTLSDVMNIRRAAGERAGSGRDACKTRAVHSIVKIRRNRRYMSA